MVRRVLGSTIGIIMHCQLRARVGSSEQRPARAICNNQNPRQQYAINSRDMCPDPTSTGSGALCCVERPQQTLPSEAQHSAAEVQNLILA